MKRRIGFSTQILLLLISLCVLCIGLVGVISYRITKKLNTDLVMTNIQTLTDATYNLIDSAVNASIRNHLRAIAEQNQKVMEMFYSHVKSGDLTADAARAEIEKLFLNQTIGETGYTYVIDSNGILKVHPLLKGSNLSKYAFINEQISRKKGYMEYLWKNPTDIQPREKALYMTYFEKWDAIISVSSYKSEFTSLININDFKSKILAIVLGQTGYMYIMNSQGKLIVHPKLEGTSIFESIDSQGNHFIQNIIKTKNGTIVYPWRNPGEAVPRVKIVIYRYFEPLDWYLCSGVYIDELIEPIESMRNRLAFIALCILIFAVCMSLWYSKILLQPINGLIQATKNVIDGDYDGDVELDTERGDEIGSLTEIFCKMLKQVRQYLTELETVNINLEKKVEERTRQLEALSNQDGLTGIANRRKLDEYLKHEFEMAARNKLTLSIIILDIDYFKRFNDTYGHPMGDTCLKKVAQELSATLQRATDFVARYGGEEFVAVLSNSSHKDTLEIAERIRTKIELLAIPHEASLVAPIVTISLGVCTLTDYQSISLNDFIALADRALYKAKENGRNRTESLRA
ncbi:diguanylate cyclase [Desulfopila sp. IMCC35008]|uniref:diguanylate cyclase n=1 Tax=Desulfopila sp. IMCC35008 TaxID=2653858 RepID=UPI0013D602B6|nr:diguanylate cyclase [Desulfopila sp. IMCC35008]